MVVRLPGLWLLVAGCGAVPGPPTPASADPRGVTLPIAASSDAGVGPGETLAAPNLLDVETSDAAAPPVACSPPRAMPDRICSDARLAAKLTELDRHDAPDGAPRCRPLDVGDLAVVELLKGHAGDTGVGAAFFGDQDIDGDGRRDLVLLYTSVDYWSWFVFLRRSGCLRFVAAIDGHQVELLPSKHAGVRDVRVWTYPLQGRTERRAFDGREYRPLAK
jgi:hypothetical protein